MGDSNTILFANVCYVENGKVSKDVFRGDIISNSGVSFGVEIADMYDTVLGLDSSAPLANPIKTNPFIERSTVESLPLVTIILRSCRGTKIVPLVI
jgi:hypothetical protein